MDNKYTLQDIKEDKKKMEDEFNRLVFEFEQKYPGFKVESVSMERQRPVATCYQQPKLTINIKIPWL